MTEIPPIAFRKLFHWVATFRCDQEEYFCTDEIDYYLSTSVLSEAAALVERDCRNNTLIELKRIV